MDIGYTKGSTRARGDTDKKRKSYSLKEGRMLLKEEMKKVRKDGSVDGFMKKEGT